MQYLLNLLKDNGQSSIDKHVQYVHGHVHVDETDSTTGTSLRTADVTAHSPPKGMQAQSQCTYSSGRNTHLQSNASNQCTSPYFK